MYEELTKYIPIFEDKDKAKGEWHGGLLENPATFPFPIYPIEVKEFFEFVFPNSSILDRMYGGKMDKNNWWDENIMLKDMPNMTAEDVGTCLTAIMRQERFCDGTIGRFLDNGLIIELLKRLMTINSKM